MSEVVDNKKPMPNATEAQIQAIVAKYSFRNMMTIIAAAFAVGAWSTALQMGQTSLKKEVDSNASAITDVNQWRYTATRTIDSHDWSIKDHEKRINYVEKRP